MRSDQVDGRKVRSIWETDNHGNKETERASEIRVKGQEEVSDFVWRKILRDEKIKDKEEEQQQDFRRQKNYMIFGAKEIKETNDS